MIDIEDNANRFVFNHEIFHVYEQHILGILLHSNDFLTITKDKLTVTSVDRGETRRELESHDQFTKLTFHSLQEFAYLRLDDTNHVSLRYPDDNNNVEISIQERYRRQDKTVYQDIFRLYIEEMSFWELLLVRNLSYCSTEKMASMIQEQPSSRVFFKSFLELDMCNLATLLSFDSRLVSALLSEDKVEEMQHEYPIIYRIRKRGSKSEECQTAIDIALGEHQVQAVNLMISYIVRHQNAPSYAYLFRENFTSLLGKGINVGALLRSEIFYHKLQFDDSDWP